MYYDNVNISGLWGNRVNSDSDASREILGASSITTERLCLVKEMLFAQRNTTQYR